MRPRSIFLAAVLLAANLSAIAQGQSSSPTKPKPKPKTAATAQKEVQVLRDAVAAQQQQLEAQRQELDAVRGQLQQLIDANQQAAAAAQKSQSSAEQASATAEQAVRAAADAQNAADRASSSTNETKSALALVKTKTQDEDKRIGALQDILGRFRFSGDVRVRGEGFYQDRVQTRNRARIRVRFGLDGKLGDDFIGAFALASGSLGDPTTTNETLTNFFDRKTIGLDRGYITYNPHEAKWLSLTGGKFAYTWNRTSITMDPDINPEGFNEKFSFDLKTSFVKNVTVQGLQLLYNEVTRGNDSFGVGGQASTRLAAGPWTSTASFTLLDWHFVDALLASSAFANQATTSGNPAIPVPGEGPGCATGFALASVPPCAFAANGATNATFVGGNGVRHFLSGFEYADFILDNQFRTGIARFPLNLLLEYEDNLKAASHPLDATGNLLTSLGSQGKSYMADVSLGRSKSENDIQVGYSFWRIGQDAILASWAQSDQRAPTNILQHRIYGSWRVRPRVSAEYTLWLGRTLNSSLEHAVLATGVAPGHTEPILKRQQFDLVYTF